jgi:hypothetical protein
VATGIAVFVFGVIVLVFGVSAYHDRLSNAMPLLFRSLHQSTSASIGMGMMVIGAAIAVIGIAIAFSG